MRTPTLFISHGSPMLAIEPSPARDFLIEYGKTLKKPRAIVIASAHFETSRPAVVGDAKPGMIYDFGGFPDALYQIVYPAPGDPIVATKVGGLLAAAGFAPAMVSNRGFDHGAWVPLSLMFPEADVPVVQLALQPHFGAGHHVKLGRALASLKDEDILVIGSGNAGHNLHVFFDLRRRGEDFSMSAPEESGRRVPDWVLQFDDWVRDKVQTGKVDELIDYRNRAPFARENHPSEEHFLPLHVAVGAAGEGAKGELLHSSYANGVLSMDAYVFQ
jgi:4,5-DOPA dioxygenase extradiol